ncbi:MAG TPA: adenosine deaminase [Prolixibacteraceae bacterium]
MENLVEYIEQLPKAELHLHIEGTFEPELMFKIAARNNIPLKYNSVEELRNAYDFNNLQDFLDIYYSGAGVLRNEEDFYDLTWAYLERASKDRVLHTEIFFDPQTHRANGVQLKTVICGIRAALTDGNEKWGISSCMIMCFLRHLDESSAFELLEEALPYRDLITAVGLDSSENGNPPEKFERVFCKAREYGFLTVAHAGEEGPADNIRNSVELLKVSRIDHGNSCIDDEELVKLLREREIPLTLCPLSNLKLKVVDQLEDHPLLRMLLKGLIVTINSDDPAYFGGYVNENYIALMRALNLDREQLYVVATNSFHASFLPESTRQKYLHLLDNFNNGEIGQKANRNHILGL